MLSYLHLTRFKLFSSTQCNIQYIDTERPHGGEGALAAGRHAEDAALVSLRHA